MWKGGVYFTGFLYITNNKIVNRWMEAVLKEELPPTTEFEENLQNGVFLAKLGNIIAPETVPLTKIYDLDQKLYKVAGLQFRHTDNINYWLKSLETASLPTVSEKLLLSLLFVSTITLPADLC
jgi:Ras GTPase-activating-like protein IQGAP2/3/Ras GTPase-activating-like protein IQGAP1